MKLLVDNQPAEIIETQETSLNEVIERISNDLQEQNRVISEIYVNGRMMTGWNDETLSSMKVGTCDSMRLISEEPRKLAHKVLYDIAGFMGNIQNALVECSTKIQSRNEQEGLQILETITSTWAELYMGLQKAIAVTGVGFENIFVEGKSFSQINEEIHQYLDDVSELVQEQQFLELSDVLEYEIAPRVPQIREGIYKLIKETEKKPH